MDLQTRDAGRLAAFVKEMKDALCDAAGITLPGSTPS